MSFLDNLPKPFFVLAPMDDVTDSVFRQIVAECAKPDLFFTEFTNVDGLQSPGRARLLKKMRFTERESPLIAQLWGKDPENFYKTARQIADGTFAREFGLPDGVNFAGIDLNMGCPQKSEVKAGTCSALINNRPLALEIIKATQEGAGGELPVSVKTRLGFSTVDLSWHEFLLQQNLAMLTIHGRTRKEMSKVPAHWDLIGEVRKLRDKLTPETLIVGNGDVESRRQGEELASKFQLDGIMIARGIFHDPFIFAPHVAKGRTFCSPWEHFSKEQRIDLFRRHVELFAAIWKNNPSTGSGRVNERPIHTLNKFCKIYINGFDGASTLRVALMLAESQGEILELLENHQRAQPLASPEARGYDGAMSEAIKAVIFDSDGTLLDTRELILQGYKTVLRKHGLEHLANDHYIRQRLGKPVPETYEQIIAGHEVSISVQELAEEHDKVQDAIVSLIKPYPHTHEILRHWKQDGVRLCLFTSGKRTMIERNFAAAGMPDPYELFDAIVTADDALARKPEPDAINELLRRVGVEPRNAVVVGDHAYDMIAASRAHVGLKVGILHGFGTSHELLTAGADFLADSLDSLGHLMYFATDKE